MTKRRNNDDIWISEITKEFGQDGDTMGDGEVNNIRITAYSEGYAVIETPRWALNPEDLEDFITEIRNVIDEANRDRIQENNDAV